LRYSTQNHKKNHFFFVANIFEYQLITFFLNEKLEKKGNFSRKITQLFASKSENEGNFDVKMRGIFSLHLRVTSYIFFVCEKL
jgi:hypothetical protein